MYKSMHWSQLTCVNDSKTGSAFRVKNVELAGGPQRSRTAHIITIRGCPVCVCAVICNSLLALFTSCVVLKLLLKNNNQL